MIHKASLASGLIIVWLLSANVIQAQRGGPVRKAPSRRAVPSLVVQLGHLGGINAVSVSKDGRYVVTGSNDGTVLLWDAVTFEEIKRFVAGGHEILSAAISPDGSQIIAGSYNVIHVWDVRTGNETHRIKWAGHPQEVKQVEFSPDGHSILSAGLRAQLWSLATEKEVANFGLHKAEASSAEFSERGNHILTAEDDGSVVLWNRQTGDALRRFEGYAPVALSRDERYVVTTGITSGSNKEVRLWDVSSGKELRTFLCPDTYILSIEFSPDDEYIITGHSDNTARAWYTANGNLARSFIGHTGSVRSLKFLPGSHLFLTGSADGTARVWNTETDQEVHQLQGYASQITSIAVSADGGFLLTGNSDHSAHLWDVSVGGEVRQFERQADAVTSVAFSPDGRYVLTGSGDIYGSHNVGPTNNSTAVDLSARLWEVSTGIESRKFERGGGPVAFSSDGKEVLTTGGACECIARLWDVSTGQELHRLRGRPSDVIAAAISPDGRLVLTSFYSRGVILWDVVTEQPLRFFNRGDIDHSRINSVAFSPDGRFILFGGKLSINPYRYKGLTEIYSTITGDLIQSFEGQPDEVTAVAFSPTEPPATDEDRKQIEWENQAVKKLSPEDRQTFLSLTLPLDLPVLSASGDPDGADKTARLWDSGTGRLVRSFKGHYADVTSVAFYPGNRFVFTGSKDGTARLWDASTGEELCRLISFRDGTWVVVDTEGRFDTNNLEDIKGLHWLFPDNPTRPLPLEIFMRQYYEPRLLPRIIANKLSGKTFSPVPPLASLNRVQPKIEITQICQQQGAEPMVSVVVKVTEPKGSPASTGKGGVYDLRLFRNRQLVGYVQRVNERAGESSITFRDIKLPHYDNATRVEFSAYAFNRDKVKSLTDRESFEMPAQLAGYKKRAYLITMGVDIFESSGIDKLLYPANDARLMRDTLSEKLRSELDYDVVPIPLIADFDVPEGETIIQPTKDNLKTIINLLAGNQVATERLARIPDQLRLQIKAATPDDLVLISFSTHGEADEQGNFYLYPYDIGVASRGAELRRHLISSEEMSLWLRDVDAADIVMILDACHSAAAPGADFKPGPMGSRGLGQLAYDKGMRILAATQADNVALGSGESLSGLLTKALILDGLREGKALKDGRFMLRDWLEYGVKRVPELYQELPPDERKRKVQHPALFDFNRNKG